MLTVPPGSAHTNHPCFEKKHFAPRNDEAGTLGGDGGWGRREVVQVMTGG